MAATRSGLVPRACPRAPSAFAEMTAFRFGRVPSLADFLVFFLVPVTAVFLAAIYASRVEKFQQPAKRLSTVAVCILLCFIQLGKTFLSRSEVEHRIVSEPAPAPRLLQNFAVHFCGDNGQELPLAYQRDHANEIRGAFRPTFVPHFPQQLRDFLFVA